MKIARLMKNASTHIKTRVINTISKAKFDFSKHFEGRYKISTDLSARGLLKSSGNWFCSSIPGGIGAVPFYLSIPDVAQAVARKKLKLTNVREGRGLGRGVRVGRGRGVCSIIYWRFLYMKMESFSRVCNEIRNCNDVSINYIHF
jgi:hypothetical protein